MTCVVYYSESMIEVNIERAVSCMQSVIELGRLVRDRNTLPLKVRLWYYLINLFYIIMC